MTEKNRVWETPKLTRFGTFVELTKQCEKLLGVSDGFLFMGQPIQTGACTS